MAKFRRAIESWARKPFKQGDGIHSDIYIAACYLLDDGYSQEEIFPFLRKGCDCVVERNIPDREIWSAIRYAAMKVKGLIQSYRWPKADVNLQNEIKSKFPADMMRLKRQAEGYDQTQAHYLRLLYPPESLVCIAADAYNWQTLPLDDAIKVVNSYYMEYINPSPMSALTGITEEGKVSSHCRNNTGDRTWLVIEFDQASLSDQHSYHQYLSLTAFQRLMVYSGSKSIHGWYDFSGLSESQATNFFELAALLGCDPRTWSKSQFVRMPAGRNHKTQRIQKIIQINEHQTR